MITEASKREKIANAVLGATFALSAAQSPQDFVKTGKIESPGAALMQTWAKKRGEAERNLDSGRVSHPARNRMKKTFREFIEEAILISEMQKQDKVAGRKKTPLTLPVKYVTKDENGKWRVKVTQRPNPDVGMGRYKQGRGMPGDAGHHHYSTEGGTSGGAGFGYRPQPHGTGGELRGVKKKDQPAEYQGRTPAQKVADKRKKAAYTGYDYKRQF